MPHIYGLLTDVPLTFQVRGQIKITPSKEGETPSVLMWGDFHTHLCSLALLSLRKNGDYPQSNQSPIIHFQNITFKTNSELSKGLFTRKERYPNKRVEVSSGLQANCTCGVTLSPESTLQALLTCFVMREILRNSPKFEIILKFSMENALSSQKRENIIIVDRT